MSRVPAGLCPSILVVEDNPLHVQHAKESLAEYEVEIVSTYHDATLARGMRHFDAVLTDLYLPSGNAQSINITGFQNEIVTKIQDYANSRFPLQDKTLASHALDHVAQTLGFESAQAYVSSDIWKQMNPEGSIGYKIAMDALHQRRDYAGFLKYEKLREQILSGAHQLPWGLRIAQDHFEIDNTPVCIVTDVYHHDAGFEPFRSSLKVPYLDQLVDEKKPWKQAFEKIAGDVR